MAVIVTISIVKRIYLKYDALNYNLRLHHHRI